MKLLRIFSSVVLLVALSASSLFAEDQKDMSADELLNGCELALKGAGGSILTDADSLRATRTIAYVDGYIGAIKMIQEIMPKSTFMDFTRQPSKKVIYNRIVEVIHAHPKARAEGTARMVIMYVFRELMLIDETKDPAR